MYKFNGKPGKLYKTELEELEEIKQNYRCKAEEQNGTGPGSCGGASKDKTQSTSSRKLTADKLPTKREITAAEKSDIKSIFRQKGYDKEDVEKMATVLDNTGIKASKGASAEELYKDPKKWEDYKNDVGKILKSYGIKEKSVPDVLGLIMSKSYNPELTKAMKELNLFRSGDPMSDTAQKEFKQIYPPKRSKK
jgi:hypothetical protein